MCACVRIRQTNYIILWNHVTVETDLQAGASHRFEVNKTAKEKDEIHEIMEEIKGEQEIKPLVVI